MEIVNFTKNVHGNGLALEKRVISYLDSQNIPYKYNKTNGIDFVISGGFHMDCIAQQVSGSIGDKLPHKCFKYIQKYKLNGKDIYILQPYHPILKSVGEHLELLEKFYQCNIHILSWYDFTYLMNGGIFETRQPYSYVKKNNVPSFAPNNININKFFKFQK
jgi:hypothetical protein